MKKLLLAGVAVLLLSTGTAHEREWQGNMPKPIGTVISTGRMCNPKLDTRAVRKQKVFSARGCVG